MSIQLTWEPSRGGFDIAEFIRPVDNALKECLRQTIFECEFWIEMKVPLRDGDLRDSLLKNLRKSNVQAGVLTLTIDPEQPYAIHVNKMTTGQVRHYNTPYEHSGKRAYGKHGKVILDDPEAEGFFLNKLVEYAKERLMINFDKAKYMYMQGRKYFREGFTIG